MGPPKLLCPGRISAETEDMGNPGSGQNGVGGGQHGRVVPTPGPQIDPGGPHDQSPTRGPLLGHKYVADQAEIREIRRRGRRARRPGGGVKQNIHKNEQNHVLSCIRLVADVVGPSTPLGGFLGSSLLKKKEWGWCVLPEES